MKSLVLCLLAVCYICEARNKMVIIAMSGLRLVIEIAIIRYTLYIICKDRSEFCWLRQGDDKLFKEFLKKTQQNFEELFQVSGFMHCIYNAASCRIKSSLETPGVCVSVNVSIT